MGVTQRKGDALVFFADHEQVDKLQVKSTIAERNLVGNEESSSKSSIVRPLACGLLTAFLVLLIGLAAWALVGIDQKSQLIARFADVDQRCKNEGVMGIFILVLIF